MAAFENAAAVLKRAMVQFSERAQGAEQRFQELGRELEELEKGLDTDWVAFAAAVKELAEDVDTSGTTLAEECGEAGAALDGLETALGERQTAVQAGFEALEKEVDLLNNAAQHMVTALEQAVDEGAEKPCETIGQQATEALQHFQKGLDGAAEFLKGEFVEEVKSEVSMAEMLSQASVNITNENAAWLSDVAQDCAVKLTQAFEHVEKTAFEAAQQQAASVLAEAHAQCESAHYEALQRLAALLTEAQQKLTELKAEVEEKETDLKGPTPLFATDTEAVKTAAQEAGTSLARVAEELRERGYM